MVVARATTSVRLLPRALLVPAIGDVARPEQPVARRGKPAWPSRLAAVDYPIWNFTCGLTALACPQRAEMSEQMRNARRQMAVRTVIHRHTFTLFSARDA